MQRSLMAVALTSCLAAGCAGNGDGAPPLPHDRAGSEQDAYWVPGQVEGSRQEYAPDGRPFPAIMTWRDGYPTDEQASAALRRSRRGLMPVRNLVAKTGQTIPIPLNAPVETAAGVRLFSCRPGALSGHTGRVRGYQGPVVTCACDLLSVQGHVLARVPLNFYYWRSAWRVQDPAPGYRPPPWAERQHSPASSRGWFGDRY